MIPVSVRGLVGAEIATTYRGFLDADLREILTRYGPLPGVEDVQQEGAWREAGEVRMLRLTDGSTLTERIELADAPREMRYVVSDLSPPLGLLVRAMHGRFHFVECGDRTEATWSYRFELTSRWAWPLAFPIVKTFWRGTMRRAFGRTKATIEAGIADR